MLTRRSFLERTLKGSSLIALGPIVPGFLASAARAAGPGQDNVLVVLDAGHDAPRIAHLLGDLPVEITGRLRSEPGDAPAEALARGVRPVRYGPGGRI